MSLTVIFDRILGRLREKDYDTGGGGTPSVPDPNSYFKYTITPDNQQYFADQQICQGMTVTVVLKFNGNNVDADARPDGWTRQSVGVYTKSLSVPGTIGPQAWSYTPGGQFEDRVATLSTPARSLTEIFPAYWGMCKTNDTSESSPGRIAEIIAQLCEQHREISNVSNRVVNVEGDPKDETWLWVVTRASATVVDAIFGQNVMGEPVNLTDFASPVNNGITLSGYKAYVSKNSVAPGYDTGDLRFNINIAHTP